MNLESVILRDYISKKRNKLGWPKMIDIKKASLKKSVRLNLSGWQDSNLRPPGPQTCALTH